LMLRRLTRRAHVALWSALPDDVVRTLGLHPLRSLTDGIEWIRDRVAGDFSYAVAPYANVMSAAVDHQDASPLSVDWRRAYPTDPSLPTQPRSEEVR
jgi:hypothetical protein